MSQHKKTTADRSAPKKKDQDWGLDDKESGGSQVKIALLLVVTLIAGLSFIVYRKYTDQQEQVVQSGEFRGVDDGSDSAGSSGVPGDASVSDLPEPGERDGFAFAGNDKTADNNPSEVVQVSESVPVQEEEPAVLNWSEPGNENEDAAPEQATFAFDEDPAPVDARATTDDEESWNPFTSDEVPPEQPTETEVVAVAADDPFFATEDSEPAEFDSDAFAPEFNREPRVAEVESGDSEWDFGDDSAPQQEGSPMLVTENTIDLDDSEPAVNLFESDNVPDAEEANPEIVPPAGSPFVVADEDVSFDASPQFPESDDEPLRIETPAADVIPVASEDNLDEDSSVETWESVPVRSSTSLADASEESPFFFDEPAAEDQPEFEDQEPGFDSFPAGDPAPVEIADNQISDFPSDTAPSTSGDPFSPATTNWSGAPGGDAVDLHVVRRGENFWTISQRHYGAGRYFSALAAYNSERIPDPQRMQPGMKVLIPSREALEQRFPNLTGTPYGPSPAEEERPGFFVDRTGQAMYRVGKNDTLSGIARKHLGRSFRWKQLYGMNQDVLTDSESLKIGMVLRLPADATQVSVAPEGRILR